jgi:hypothetical protein
VRTLVGLLSFALIAMMLAEFFVVFLLPRRVKREPRIARQFILALWRPWRAVAGRLPRVAADTVLGIFGPLSLLVVLAVLSFGLILGFAGLHWANHSNLDGPGGIGFGDDLYFSTGSFLSASTPLSAGNGFAEGLEIAEAASGFAVLFIAIGYLPALFQAFSRRETAISQLDPRAGSPPTAGALLVRSGERGGWRELDSYMREWETWAAELMETHLSYPVIGYFRSQHINQNWLAGLTAVVDTCAFCLAYSPTEESAEGAEFTFAIGRHALADLAYSFRARVRPEQSDRLPPEDLEELLSRLEGSGLRLAEDEGAGERLRELRESYDKYAVAISRQLALPLPSWLAPEDAIENWRLASARRHRRKPLT